MNLFFTDGQKKGEKYEISPPGISIGRELDNDIILELEGASRYHAKLIFQDSHWFLKDLGSTNGTKLNGEKITSSTEVKLKEEDNIRIGKQTMCFAEKLEEKQSDDIPIIKSPSPESESLHIEHSAITMSEMEPTSKKEGDLPSTKDKNTGMSDSKSFLNFFDNQDSPEETTAVPDKLDFFGKQEATNEENQLTSKKHAGLIFYVAVLGAAIILIGGFLIIEQNKEQKQSPASIKKAKKGVPLLLRFEKQITSSDPRHNIFRFLMEIKNGTVTITRDDLQAGLKDQLSRKVTPDQLLELEDQLQEIDFMSTKQGQAGIPRPGEDRLLKLTIAYGKEMNSITVKNTSPPRSFEEAVKIVEDFSANVLNVPAISLTPEELKEDGMNAYRKGKQLFDNYRAQSNNLSQAIKYFKVAIENLAAFQPEPTEYKEAYRMKNESERMLQGQIRAHNRNAMRYRQLKEYPQAKEEYMEIMEKTAPGSTPYSKSREKIIQLEKLIRKKR